MGGADLLVPAVANRQAVGAAAAFAERVRLCDSTF